MADLAMLIFFVQEARSTNAVEKLKLMVRNTASALRHDPTKDAAKEARRPFTNWLKTLACVGLTSVSFMSSAEIFSIIDSKPISELWLNPGASSYHFHGNKELNNSNFGLGSEYRYSTVSSVALGMFDNSDRQISHYAGWCWLPIGLGPFRFGGVIGAMDGYPYLHNGGWIIAGMLTAAIEYKNIGANLILIPGYKDRSDGSISLQLKLRVF